MPRKKSTPPAEMPENGSVNPAAETEVNCFPSRGQ